MSKLLLHCSSALVILVSLRAGAAQLRASTDLRDRWILSEGTVVEMTQSGNQIESRFVSVGADAKREGFAPGDINFRGTFDGHEIKARMNFHYALGVKKTCPAQWESMRNVVLALSSDGHVLSGLLPHTLIFSDCSERAAGFHTVSYMREVIEFEIRSEVNVFPEPPTRLAIKLKSPSALVNDTIDCRIGVASDEHSTVAADRDYRVALSATRGVISPDQLTIHKGSTHASATLKATMPGDVHLKAVTTEGLRPASQVATFCDSGQITTFLLINDRQEAPADAKTPISIIIKFVSAQGVPVTGQQLKAVGLDYRGVGKWRAAANETATFSRDLTIRADECVATQELTSDRPGTASLKVSFRTRSEDRDFVFFVPLTSRLFLWAGLGGVAGAFVRLCQKRLRRKSIHRYLVQFLIGIIAGIVLLLMCYFGFITWAASKFPSSFGFGFLLGVAGGYLGAATLDKLITSVFPPVEAQVR